MDNAYPIYRAPAKRRRLSIESDSDSSYGSEFEDDLPVPTRKAVDDTRMSIERQETKVKTVDDRIEDSNVGAKLLAKMGWKQGSGLGRNRRVDPIRIVDQHGALGLGIAIRDFEALEMTTAKGREILSVKIGKETEEERERRETGVAKQAAIKDEIMQTIAGFNCELCNKQYQTSQQFQEHENSYDHHHKKRTAEYKATQKAASLASGDLSRRRDKERRREEKDLQRQFGISSSLSKAPLPSTSKLPMNEESQIPGIAEVKKVKSGFRKVQPVLNAELSEGADTRAAIETRDNIHQMSLAQEGQPPLPKDDPPPPPPSLPRAIRITPIRAGHKTAFSNIDNVEQENRLTGQPNSQSQTIHSTFKMKLKR